MATSAPDGRPARRVEGRLTQFLTKEEAPHKGGIVKETWRSTFFEGMPMMVDHGKLQIKGPVGKGIRSAETSDWALCAGEVDLTTTEGRLANHLIDTGELTHFSVAVRQQDPKDGPADIWDRRVVEFSLTSKDRAVEPGARIIVCHSNTGEEVKVPVYVYSAPLTASPPTPSASPQPQPAAPQPQPQQQQSGAATLETSPAQAAEPKPAAASTGTQAPPGAQSATATVVPQPAAAAASTTQPQTNDMSAATGAPNSAAGGAPAGQQAGAPGTEKQAAGTAGDAPKAKPNIDLSGVKLGNKRSAPGASDEKKTATTDAHEKKAAPTADADEAEEEQEEATETKEQQQPPAKKETTTVTPKEKKQPAAATTQPPAKRTATESKQQKNASDNSAAAKKAAEQEKAAPTQDTDMGEAEEVEKALEVVDKAPDNESTKAMKLLLNTMHKKLEAEKKAAEAERAKLEERLKAVEQEREEAKRAAAEKLALETRGKISQIRDVAKTAGITKFDENTEAVLEALWGQEQAQPLVAAFLQALDKASGSRGGPDRTGSDRPGLASDAWRGTLLNQQARSAPSLITVEHSRTGTQQPPQVQQKKVDTKPSSTTPVSTAFPRLPSIEEWRKSQYKGESFESVEQRAARARQQFGSDRFGN